MAMRLFNGAVPFGDPPEGMSFVRRAQRIACCAVNHQPRIRTGSWCGGFDYVCGRCYMYVGPWSKQRLDAVVTALGPHADQMDIAAAFGGGPPR